VNQVWLALLGQLLIVSLIALILVFYLFYFRRELFVDTRRLLVLLFNLVAIVALFSFSSRQGISSIYLIPFCILPIITRALFDAWVAMMTLVVATLLCSFFSANPSEFLVLQLSTGMAAIFSLISIRRRSQFYITSGLIFGVYALGYTANTLISKGDYTELIPLYYGYFGVNALFTLIASPLLFGYEKLFGFVSDVTLMELSDTNNPLLRTLSFQAPGTFQHSLQVSNLAEAAIYEIGGNPLLVRVGALYHDIGKINNPMYFIENQSGLNPHDDLPFEDSAQIIVGHVLDGIDMAKKHKLPNSLIDFIRTHHGDQRVEYFYQSFLKNYPHQAVDETKFRYPGPKPFSKETAVLMMADSVEAASRSLKSPTEQSIDELVENIIAKQIKNEQFINANITLRDISRIKKLFKKMLGSIYHVRIAYPKA
jgi:putative nucleotidyltransferase with HDIG domain